MVALAILSTSFTALAIQTGFERRYGVLRRVGDHPAHPVRRPRRAKPSRCSRSRPSRSSLLGVIGGALGWRPEPVGLLLLVPLTLLGSAALAALALLLAGVVRAEATLAVANLAYLLLAGAGVVIPLDQLPEGVQPFVAAAALCGARRGLRLACADGTLAWSPGRGARASGSPPQPRPWPAGSAGSDPLATSTKSCSDVVHPSGRSAPKHGYIQAVADRHRPDEGVPCHAPLTSRRPDRRRRPARPVPGRQQRKLLTTPRSRSCTASPTSPSTSTSTATSRSTTSSPATLPGRWTCPPTPTRWRSPTRTTSRPCCSGPADVTVAAGGNYTIVAHLDAKGEPTVTPFENDISEVARR